MGVTRHTHTHTTHTNTHLQGQDVLTLLKVSVSLEKTLERKVWKGNITKAERKIKLKLEYYVLLHIGGSDVVTDNLLLCCFHRVYADISLKVLHLSNVWCKAAALTRGFYQKTSLFL